MPRSAVPAVLQWMDDPHINLTFLMKLSLRDEDIRAALSPINIYWREEVAAAEHEFVGLGQFAAIGELEESDEVGVYTTQVELAGIDQSPLELVKFLNIDYYNRPIIIWLAPLGVDNEVIEDINGFGPIRYFSGRVQTVNIDYTEDGAKLILDCVSRLVDWEAPRGGEFSHQYQTTRVDPTDRGFEYMTQIPNLDLVWGGKGPRVTLTRPTDPGLPETYMSWDEDYS